MNNIHQGFVEYLLKNHQLKESELELDYAILDAVRSMSPETLAGWNPYGDKQILAELRESRLRESTVILFDLDGYEDAGHGVRRHGGLVSLVNESKSNFASAVIGLPQVLMRPSGKEEQWIVSWDSDRTDTSFDIPSDEIPEMFSDHLDRYSDDRMKRQGRHLDFTRWLLHVKGTLAKAFFDYAGGKGLDTVLPGEEWLVDGIRAISDRRRSSDRENVAADVQDPIMEITGYIADIDSLGWLEMAGEDEMEKVLKGIAYRSRLESDQAESGR